MPGIEEYLYGKPLRIDYEELHPDSWELVFIHCNPAVEILDWEIDPNKSYIVMRHKDHGFKIWEGKTNDGL